MRSLVLLSGGVDSAACVSFYLRLGHAVEALFVDYGQPSGRGEEIAASAVANRFSVPLYTVLCQGPTVPFSGEILGRNAFLLLTALLFRPSHNGIVAIGIHAGSKYYDCHPSFLHDMERIVSGYTHGRISVGAPFLSWSKDMIWEFCVRNDVPIGLTWSCEVASDVPCGRCLSCRDLEALHARAK